MRVFTRLLTLAALAITATACNDEAASTGDDIQDVSSDTGRDVDIDVADGTDDSEDTDTTPDVEPDVQPDVQPDVEPDVEPDVPVELDGYELYLSNCSSCHGDNAEGGADGYQIQNADRAYTTWLVRNGRTTTLFPNDMDAFDTEALTDEELTAILDYLTSFENPADGEGLYWMYCATCHGDDARGGPTGQGIDRETDEFIQANRRGKGGRNYGSRRSYMPARTASQISDTEMNLIADYVESL